MRGACGGRVGARGGAGRLGGGEGTMPEKYRVCLGDDDRATLRGLLAGGRHPARVLTRARILLKADEAAGGAAWADGAIVAALDVSRPTVQRVRQRFAADGLADALFHRAPRATKPCALDGEQEAHLVALACGTAPAGRDRWSLRLLAERFVVLAEAGEERRVSHETVRRALKKTS